MINYIDLHRVARPDWWQMQRRGSVASSTTTTPFHWQDPSPSTERTGRQDKPSPCFFVPWVASLAGLVRLDDLTLNGGVAPTPQYSIWNIFTTHPTSMSVDCMTAQSEKARNYFSSSSSSSWFFSFLSRFKSVAKKWVPFSRPFELLVAVARFWRCSFCSLSLSLYIYIYISRIGL